MNNLKSILYLGLLLVLMNPIHAQKLRKYQLVIRTTGTLTSNSGHEISLYGFCKDKTSSPQLPGPKIVAELGDTLEIEVTNISQQPQTVHFHGINTTTSECGNPVTSFSLAHRQKYTYRFIAHQSGTYCYYGGVSNLPYAALGLYGLLRIVEKIEISDEQPEKPIGDNMFVTSELDTVWSQLMSEPLEEQNPLNTLVKHSPNVFLLNADPNNELSLPIRKRNNGLYALQLINAGLSDNRYIFPKTMEVYISKTDAYTAPYFMPKDTLLVSPGERYELLINYNSNQEFKIDLEYLSLNNSSILSTKKLNFTWSKFTEESYKAQKKAITVWNEPLMNPNAIRIATAYPEYQINELQVYQFSGKLISKIPIHFLELNDHYLMNINNLWSNYHYLRIQTNKNIYWKNIRIQSQYNEE